MIKQINKTHIEECTEVIKKSFLTVAKQFGITEDNAPSYVAFATNSKKLEKQLSDGRLMYAYFSDNKIIGFYSLALYNNKCEISNLCVLPEYRHCRIGKSLLEHAFEKAKETECEKIEISIVEENDILKKWYEKFGFKSTYTKKYDFFPFTCGYMEKRIEQQTDKS